MAELAHAVEPLRERAAHARKQVLDSLWLERVARLGYASKGLVYLLVGALAVPAAFGAREDIAGVRGTLRVIVRQPFGSIVLGMVALGLGVYVLWRLLQAGVDPEGKGTDIKGITQRLAYVVSGLVFANLTWDALEIVIGWGRGDIDTTEDWTALALAQPLGRWLVALGGGIVIGVALYQFYAAYTARFRRKLKLSEMSAREAVWMTRIGRFGLATRGLVFAIIGGFLIVAAWNAQAARVRGLGEALTGLAGPPFGPWILAIVALGLVAYGIYTLAEARYRRVVM
jgi:hypothetical protein